MDDSRSLHITRRHALAVGAAAGLGVVLRPALPALGAVDAGSDRFTLGLRAGTVGRSGTRPLAAPGPFDLLGVSGDGLTHAHLEVRTREGRGAWSAWVPLASAADHAPDGGSARKATDPVWTGRADQLQLRAGRSLGALRVHFVRVAAPSALARAAGAHAASAKRTVKGSPAFVPRASWGAGRYPPRAGAAYGRVDMAFVHHTETSNDYSASESAGIVLAIDDYHRNTLGWNDIGYNFLVDRYGTIFEGRSGGVDRAVIGAQAQGYNSFSTGISCIGSFGTHALPTAAMQAVARLIAWKLPLHGAPVTGGLTVVSGGGSLNAHPYGAKVRMQRIAGHRDGDATDCPGDRLYHELPALRRLAASYHGDPTQSGGQPTMTIVPASTAVPYRGTLVVRGALVDAFGGAIAGRGLVVEKQGRSGKWVRIATARTGSDGHWEASAVWKAAGRVRARARVSGVQIISGTVAVKLAARRR